MPVPIEKPHIRDAAANDAFERLVRSRGCDPHNPWLGGYVDYEWRHFRHVLGAAIPQLSGVRMLEFGCNVGASSIVAALLGCRVTAIDVDAAVLDIAVLNAERYGVADRINFVHVPDTRTLPFESQMFDAVVCNSVLEYIDPVQLLPVQREIDRVLAIDGTILVTGTSNRLAPREIHSNRWLSNYIPRVFDRIHGRGLQRGIFPWTVRRGFGSHYENLDFSDGGSRFLATRRNFGLSGAKLWALCALNTVCRRLGLSVGLLLPNISMTLRKTQAGRTMNRTS